MKTREKPSLRNAGIQVGIHEVDPAALRNAAQAEPKEFTRKMAALTEQGAEGEDKPLRWQHIRNTKVLLDALADVVVPGYDATQKRMVDTSAFQVLTSNLTVAGINDAYMGVPTIGDQLVTEFDDNKKTSNFVGAVSLIDTTRSRVDEGKPFPLISAGEERYQIGHKRNGARIALTQELFEESDIPGIVGMCDCLGQWAGEQIEKLTIRYVFDVDGAAGNEPYMYRPEAGASALYVASNAVQTRVDATGNLITSNALVDGSDLELARLQLAGAINSRSEPINVFGSELILLVPDALYMTAWQIKNSVLEPGVWNQKAFYGSEGPVGYRILSSTVIDQLSTSTWGLGNYPMQFYRKWKLRPEVVVMPGSTPGAAQSFLDARIGYQARIAWDMIVGARDQGVYVTKSTA